MVCYESRKIIKHEKNYVTHDLQLERIMHTLKMWRHYLLGRRFVLMIDHGGLRYFFNQPKLNDRQARWLALINEFSFEINNIKGKLNKVADALSRSLQEVHLATLSTCIVDIKERVKEELPHDEHYQHVIKFW